MIVIEKIFHEFILSSTSSITTLNILNMFIATNLISIDLKIVLFNDIIIYDDNYAVVKFFIVTKVYFNIWQKKIIDTINISEKKWISINIISEIKFDSTRVFEFDKQNRDVIDKNSTSYIVKKKWIKQRNLLRTHIFVSLSDERFICSKKRRSEKTKSS